MNAIDFVTELKSFMPSRDALLNVGCSPELAEETVRSYIVPPRTCPIDLETLGDPALELLKYWDVSTIEIGPFSFHSEPIGSVGQREIGTVDRFDPVVFRDESRDFVLLDHEVADRVMCRVAPNGGALLASLIEVAAYYRKTVTEEIDIDDERVGLTVKSRCVQILGGTEYESFATGLLGV